MDRVYDGDDDDDGNSSGYDADIEDEDNEDEEEEEEHLAPADFAVVIPIDELVFPPEGTEPTIPPPSTDTTTPSTRGRGRETSSHAYSTTITTYLTITTICRGVLAVKLMKCWSFNVLEPCICYGNYLKLSRPKSRAKCPL
nr:hypothetical protein [Tanacetum cinerariifolium]